MSIEQICLNVVHFQTNNKFPALVKMVMLVVGKIPHVWLLQVLHISICVPTIWRQPAKRRIVQLVRLTRETKRPILLSEMMTKRILLTFSWFLYTIISVTVVIISTVIIVSHLGLVWLHSPIKCLRLQSGSLAYSLLLIKSVIENMRMGMLMMLIEMMAYVRMTVILDDWTTSPFR